MVADVPTAVGLLERLDEVEGLVVVTVADEKPAWVPERLREMVLTPADAKGLEYQSVCVLDPGRVLARLEAATGPMTTAHRRRCGSRNRTATDQLRHAVYVPRGIDVGSWVSTPAPAGEVVQCLLLHVHKSRRMSWSPISIRTLPWVEPMDVGCPRASGVTPCEESRPLVRPHPAASSGRDTWPETPCYGMGQASTWSMTCPGSRRPIRSTRAGRGISGALRNHPRPDSSPAERRGCRLCRRPTCSQKRSRSAALSTPAASTRARAGAFGGISERVTASRGRALRGRTGFPGEDSLF